MNSIWKRFVKKDASSNLTERVKRIKEFEVPQHIAIIMDGNGRWAKKRALPRVAGHHEGMNASGADGRPACRPARAGRIAG